MTSCVIMTCGYDVIIYLIITFITNKQSEFALRLFHMMILCTILKYMLLILKRGVQTVIQFAWS